MGLRMKGEYDSISCFAVKSDLKIVVEVGLVVGTIPASTPKGAAISTEPATLFSLITPTVLSFLIEL